MRSALALIFVLLLAGCTTVPVEMPDKGNTPNTTYAAPQIQVEVAPIKVAEKTVVQGQPELESFSILDGTLKFVNKAGEVYHSPLKTLHYIEGKDRLEYEIRQGDYMLVDANEISKAVKYLRIEPAKNKIIFLDGELPVESYYIPVLAEVRSLVGRSYGQKPRSGVSTQSDRISGITWEEVQELNPTVTFDEFADTQTIGVGEVELDGYSFRYYISYSAGNPISMDLDGDKKINGKKVLLVTQIGDKVDLTAEKN